jgi:hypothetical protein
MLLSQSQDVVETGATHLYSQYFKSFLRAVHTLRGDEVGISRIISDFEAYGWVRQFSSRFFERAAEQKQEAKIIVEKTPAHGACGADIVRLYPDSWFIHVIRDPRAVVSSLLAASRSWAADWAPANLIDASARWSGHVTHASSILQLTDRYVEVRYEQLHLNPEEELVRLFGLLEVRLQRHDAEAYVKACSIDRHRAPPVDRRAEKRLDKRFFRRGEVDSWRRELSGPDIAIIERLTRKQMAALGYEPVAGRRDRMIAEARLQAHRAANKLAKAMRAGADRIKP